MKKLICLLSIFLLFSGCIQDASKVEEIDGRFGVDGANPKAVSWISELGDGVSGVNMVTWEMIEPYPPKNGKHFYNFSAADKLVKTFQRYGRRLQLNIRCISHWATLSDNSSEREVSSPPKPEYWDDYENFIYELVERYDGDGYKDMPDLKLPIIYYQIESEPHQLFKGTAKDYVNLLKRAYIGAKRANPNVIIMAAGWNVGDLFVDNPSPETVEKRIHSSPIIEKRYEFILYVLENGKDYFDVLTIHPNSYYTGIQGTVEYFKKIMKEFGYQKPIWADDMASGFLESSVFLKNPIPEDAEEIHDILKNPEDPRYIPTLKRYESEQSKLLIKKLAIGFYVGLEKIFVSTDVDWINYYLDDWKHQGLIYINPENPKIHHKKPAFYTYKLAIEKLNYFESVERIDLGEGVHCYKFSFSNKKPVFVVWSDSQKRKINLKTYIPSQNVKIIHIITELDDKENPIIIPDEVVPADSIEIDETPIFVEY